MEAALENVKRSSMTAVADAAGVSQSTVSRVINNDCRVAPDTVLAVREAAERLDYRPRPAMNRQGPRRRKRRTIRHQQIALLYDGKPMLLHAPVYSRVAHGVEERLREDGWNLVIRTLPAERPWEAMPHRLDGVLLFGVSRSDSRFLRELRRTTAVRIMDHPVEGDFFDHVTYDDEKIGQAAAAYLLRNGHRRLVCLPSGGRDRIANFMRTVREAGAEVEAMRPPVRLIDETGKVQLPDREGMSLMPSSA